MNIRTLGLYMALIGGFATTFAADGAAQPASVPAALKVPHHPAPKKGFMSNTRAWLRKTFSGQTDHAGPVAAPAPTLAVAPVPAPAVAPAATPLMPELTETPATNEEQAAPEGGLPDIFYKKSTKISAWAATAILTVLWAYAQHGHSRSSAESYIPRSQRARLTKELDQALASPEKQQLILRKLQVAQRQLDNVNRSRTIADALRWLLGLGALGTLSIAVLPWFVKKPTLKQS